MERYQEKKPRKWDLELFGLYREKNCSFTNKNHFFEVEEQRSSGAEEPWTISKLKL